MKLRELAERLQCRLEGDGDLEQETWRRKITTAPDPKN